MDEKVRLCLTTLLNLTLRTEQVIPLVSQEEHFEFSPSERLH